MDIRWQLQTAKQRFSELIRAAESGEPQYVTRHGDEVAVVIDVGTYRQLTQAEPDFIAFLQEGPTFEGLNLERDRSVDERTVDFG